MTEKKARDERHAVSEVQPHDREIEDGVNGYGVDEHEEAFEEGTDGDESDGAGGSFVLR